MRFSVCVPTIRPTVLHHAIDSVLRQTFADWELVVVGQGDERALREATLAAGKGDPRVSYLHLNRYGASAARNAGLAATKGEIVAFLDDDCEARADWLEAFDRCFEPGIGFVAGEVTAPAPDSRLFAFCPEVHPDEVTVKSGAREVPAGFGLLGANMAIRREDAARVGSFDENLGPGSPFGGSEEHDYCYRLLLAGVTLRSTSTASVNHTYGHRYGAKDYYRYKCLRLGGDGALAAKRKLIFERGDFGIASSIWAEFTSQLTTLTPLRAPLGAFRIYHYMRNYRECLTNYVIAGNRTADPAMSVLTRRGATS
jgi:glycosyltransferase involved in cell wall biosynthesis